jgi:hypothetical protein
MRKKIDDSLTHPTQAIYHSISLMTFTQRLYRVDEVRAALLYSLKTQRIVEALFWLQELEDSSFGGEARRLLCTAWFMFVGLSRLSWIIAWSTESGSREGRLKLCWQLARCMERDSSLWWLLCAVPAAAGGNKAGLSKVYDAWSRVWGATDEDFWQPIVDWVTDQKLELVFESLQDDMRSYSLIGRCAAVAIRTCVNQLPKSTWEPLSEREPEQTVFERSGNIRKDRLYAIPYDCLFGMTWRGTGVNTLEYLRNLKEEDFQKSPWWRAKSAGIDTDDTKREEFYDAHFSWTTCDIPDEWSLADQLKSHGPGSTGATASLERWWRSWIVPDKVFLWGCPADAVTKWVKAQPGSTGQSVLDRVFQAYKECKFSPEKLPVVYKKEFILITA